LTAVHNTISPASSVRRGFVRLLQAGVVSAAIGGSSGCAWDFWSLISPPAPPAPTESLVLRGDKLEPEKAPVGNAKHSAELAGGHELHRKGDYDKAEKVFRRIADNQKNPPHVAEEARYYEAECVRRQGRLPKAADLYAKVLADFPSGQYREQAVQHMFEIANYWLDDTRSEMEQSKVKQESGKWFGWRNWLHWERSKPLLDEEGRAVEKLEQVRYNDMTGPLADKALFLCGSVKFYREDYKESDHYFTQLVEMHPNSSFAPQALELAIIAKHMSTGGSDYDGRKVAEARQLVDTALRTYPELAAKKADFLNRQLVGISLQQAEKDYKIGEFYRRTGHPQSAYFYYEIVRRRYPGTKYFDLATERMHEIRTEAEKTGSALPPAPVGGTIGRAPSGAETTPQPRPLPSEISGR
jgi:outer membrane protein assembly factor BamD (BamD/ComL family)